jgi:serine/threonine protein phosphatase PrpC
MTQLATQWRRTESLESSPLRQRDGLIVTVGHASLTGKRERNEDFCGAALPEGPERLSKGLLVAVADGLGGHTHGREAAEQIVRGLLADYYATPDTWSVAQSVDKVLTALNRWLLSHAAKNRETIGMATTLSAIVLRGNRYFTAHVGDSRIYLWRNDVLQCLTTDHVWEHPEMQHVLKRAVGLDQYLTPDYGDGDLCAGDLFILLTDGVWGALDQSQLEGELRGAGNDPDAVAKQLVNSAIARGSNDNCTAMLARVDTVPAVNLRDALAAETRLPLPPRLRVGEQLDGLRIVEVLHSSRMTVLYRVRSLASAEQLVLKTLQPEQDDDEAKAALIHEEWLTRRVTSHYFPQVVAHSERKHLYYLMRWHEGETLATRSERGHRYAPAEAVQLGIRLLKGVGALHRLAIVHRDIKPDNLHLGSDGRLRILDLGVAASDAADLVEINNPGTPSYMAPELFAGSAANIVSDLYACGVTLYYLLTRKYPYGEIEPFQRPKFGDPVSPTRYRPDLPEWLEALLLKACARDVKDRFETAEQMLLALERGANRPLSKPRRMPIAQRNPMLVLLVVLGLSLLGNLVLAYWLLRG